jgi:hypothetical protein
MMRVQRVLTMGMIVAALALAGCGTSLRNALKPSANRALFEGNYYPARLSRDRDDRAAFVVTVSRAAQGIDGAAEAGRYEATKYCIDQYGDSDALWSVGPDSEGLALQDDQLVLAGRCRG